MLLVVYSAHDLRESTHTGSHGNAPESRKRLVHEALRRRARRTPAGETDFLEVSRPETSLTRLAAKVHDEGMLRFLESAWDEWKALYSRLPNDHLVLPFANGDRGEGHAPPPFVCNFAAPRHEPGGQLPSSGVLGKLAYYVMDRETPIHASTLTTLKWDLAVVEAAVEQIRLDAMQQQRSSSSRTSRRTRAVYAQITHPGHHSFRSSFGGFCFINQTALGVRLLQERVPGVKRVAVIDVDYHAGNGTVSIFWNDPSVLVASLHADPEHEYPFNAGYREQRGGENALDTKMNVPLGGGVTWPAYRRELREVVRRASAFVPDALVVSLGLDTLEGDPVAFPNCAFRLRPEDYAEMGRVLLEEDERLAHIPQLIVQEGGYFLDRVPAAVVNFLFRASSSGEEEEEEEGTHEKARGKGGSKL